MSCYLTNNIKYIKLSASGGITKIDNVSEATILPDDVAEGMLSKFTKKLKNYKKVSVQTNIINEQFDHESEECSSDKVKKTARRQFTKSERTYVYNKYEGRCGICGDFVPVDEFTVDHIVPISKGGDYKKENLQCACRSCNMMKQDILPADMMDKIIQILNYQVKKKSDKKKYKKIKKSIKKIKRILKEQ